MVKGWLKRWEEQPKDETQLGLFGENTALTPYERVDGGTVNKALQSEIKQRGGTKKTHEVVNAKVTNNMLGCTPSELYEATGGTPGDRRSLPAEAQEALSTGDIAARHEIVSSDAQGHSAIIEATDRSTKKARKLFPW